jgi:choline dehydrogenase-like flavoprotein
MGSAADEEPRVTGLERLRAADASVIPTVFGKPNKPTVAIAKGAADLIRSQTPLPRAM